MSFAAFLTALQTGSLLLSEMGFYGVLQLSQRPYGTVGGKVT